MSTRLLSLLAGLAVAAAGPAVAVGQAGPGAGAGAARAKSKIFVARLKPLRADIRDYADMSGKARLVARSRRATITLTAKGLVPSATTTGRSRRVGAPGPG